jgi:hypothetical protein
LWRSRPPEGGANGGAERLAPQKTGEDARATS